MIRFDHDESCAKCGGGMGPRWEEHGIIGEPRGSRGYLFARCHQCGWTVQRAPLDDPDGEPNGAAIERVRERLLRTDHSAHLPGDAAL